MIIEEKYLFYLYAYSDETEGVFSDPTEEEDEDDKDDKEDESEGDNLES